MSDHKNTKEQRQLRLMGDRITKILVVIAIILIALELIFHRHGEIKMEDFPLFPAIYGFVFFVLIVFVGIGLRKLVMRGEDYYGDQ